MNKIIKRVVSAVTAVAVVLTAVFVFDVPEKMAAAAAAEGTHSHKACDGLAHGDCNHEDIVYEEFPTSSKYLSIESDKNYYLTKDLTQSDISFIYDLKNINLNLCLNGHKITSEGNLMLKSCEGCVLNICDCSGGGCMENLRTSSAVQSINGGQTNIYGGTFLSTNGSTIYTSGADSVIRVYGGKYNSQNNAVYMQGGKVYIYDGEFTSSGLKPCIQMLHSTDNKKGNLIICGGKFTSSNKCIDTQGDFSIYGGEFISSMTCIRAGSGNFSISGGNFTCNTTAEYQYVIESSGISEINISGGEMRGEQPTTMGIYLANSNSVLNMSGGSVFSYGSAVQGKVGTTPKINISGGLLSSARASAAAGGGILNMTGGTISGSDGVNTTGISMSGKITGGTIKDCSNCGISVQQNRIITIGGDVNFENNRFDIELMTADDIFTVKDDFRNTATVRVCDNVPEDTVRKITTDGTPESALSKITSADKNYTVKFDGGSGYLYLYNHVHVYDLEHDENEHWQICTKCGAEGEKSNHTWNDGEETTPPTETTEGVKTYKCTVCNAEKTEKIDKLSHTHTYSDDWTSDENGHWHAATCGHNTKSDEAEHNFDTPTVTPSTCTQRGSEEYICQTCGYKKTVTLDLAEHSFNGEWQKDVNNHWKVCTVCNTEKNEVTAHSWNDGEITKQPTEDEAGVMLYTCTVCKATKTEPIAPLDHTHDWSGEWSKDDTYHWHDCLNNCGEKKDNAAHIWDDGTVTKQPTADAEGEKTFECTVCGKTKTEILPPKDEPSDPDSGNISVDVQPGENAPETQLKTPFDELVNAVLTSEEQEQIKNGIDIKIILIVSDATASVPADDKAKIEASIRGLSGYKLGQYLDVTMLKKIGELEQAITNTHAPIKITFEIPSALRGKSEYSVIRVHGGETTILRDLDSSPDTVTIETDKFSTYALTYKEKTSGGGSGGGGSSHRHRYIYDETIIKEPTCTESGEKSLSCSCGQTTTETVPALGHDYRSEITKPATETEDGVRTFTCTRCGDTYTEIIPKTGSESKPSDTSSDTSDNTSSDTSDDTSSGVSTSDDTSSDNGDTSSDISGSSSGGDSSPSGGDNPSTGIAVSLIPLAAILSGVIIISNRRKK